MSEPPKPVSFVLSPPANSAQSRVEQADKHALNTYLLPEASERHFSKNLSNHIQETDDENETHIVLELLSLFGYDASPFDFETVSGRQNLVRVFFKVLRDLKQHHQQHEEVVSEVHSLQRTLSDTRFSIHKLKVQKEELEGQLFTLSESYRKLEEQKKKQCAKLKSSLGQTQKQNTALKSRDKQYKNEIRKRELEFDRLQARLQSALSARDRSGKSTSRIPSAPVCKRFPSGRRGHRTSEAESLISNEEAQAEITLLKDSVQHYESLTSKLEIELSKVQEFLESVYLQMHLITQQKKEDDCDEGGQYDPRLSSLPFETVREHLQGTLEQCLSKLSFIHQSRNSSDESDDRDVVISDLRKQLEDQSFLLRQQEKMLQETLLQTPALCNRSIVRAPLSAVGNRLNFMSPNACCSPAKEGRTTIPKFDDENTVAERS